MTEFQKPKGWKHKFRNAFSGLRQTIKSESSFYVHIPVAAAVLFLGAWLQVSINEMLLLTLCISAVVVAELFNSALESLARAITHQHNRHIGRALDIASGAVLVTSIVSAVIGAVILLPPLLTMLGWAQH